MQFPADVLLSLGYDPAGRFRVGAWFSVPEVAVRRVGSDEAFASSKAEEGRYGRRVVLANPGVGTKATLYPRTTGRGTRYSHSAHDHASDFPRCEINKPGRVLRIPVNVPSGELSHANWSCDEPETSGLIMVIGRWSRS